MFGSGEIEYLFKLGFVQEYPNDPEYPYLSYRLDIDKKHPILMGVHLVVSETDVEVWCLDCLSDQDRDPVCIAKRRYSRQTLKKLMQHFG